MLEDVKEVLMQRQAEVAARIPKPDPHAHALAVDADRLAQLQGRKPVAAKPKAAPAQKTETSADVGKAYTVEQNGAWFSLIGPDGKVGKSQRSAEDAWALLPSQA
jgi:hypothetical protein